MNAAKLSVVFAILLSSLCGWAAAETPEDQTNQEPTIKPVQGGGDVVHARLPIQKGDGRSNDEMGELTEESQALIEQRRNREMRGRLHPWVAPPFPGGIVEPPRNEEPLNPPVRFGTNRVASGPLVTFTDTVVSDVAPGTSRGTVAEPALAVAGDQIIFTANWWAASSTDGGATFSYVNPFSGPFAEPANEDFCCDQVTAYDPGSNTLFWLQQFIPSAGGVRGTQRINIDQGADGTWDCHLDVDPEDVGFGSQRWFDFPDLVVSDSYLWHASNVFTLQGAWAGSYAGRYLLSELAACSQSVNLDGFSSSQYFSFRFARGASDTMYFAAQHNQTNLRVYTWADGDASPTAATLPTAFWANLNHTCPGPDDREWCGRIDSRIQSGFVAGDVVGFVWTPSQNMTYPYPYTRIATYDASDNLAHLNDMNIWSEDEAFAYASTAVNSNGEIGGSVLWGGGATHPSCLVWIADPADPGTITNLETVNIITGTEGPLNGEGRSGDYTWAATNYPNDEQFVASCFAFNLPRRATTHFVRFGREDIGELFSNGFESGETNLWSDVVGSP
jgi:hypothetical protein